MSEYKPSEYKPSVRISIQQNIDMCAMYKDYNKMLYKMSKDESLSFSQKHIADYMLNSMINRYQQKCVKDGYIRSPNDFK